MIKLKASELRAMIPSEEQLKHIKKNPVYIVLDNVLDTYNIGAIFRLADAVAAEKVILCGATETPPHTRIKKASINTTEWVSWEYFEKTTDAINYLREHVNGIKIYSIEQNKKSVRYDTIKFEFPLALIVGHETDGVSQEVMDMSDAVVELPMWGVNTSLNVMVSLGIVLYKVVEHLSTNLSS